MHCSAQPWLCTGMHWALECTKNYGHWTGLDWSAQPRLCTGLDWASKGGAEALLHHHPHRGQLPIFCCRFNAADVFLFYFCERFVLLFVALVYWSPRVGRVAVGRGARGCALIASIIQYIVYSLHMCGVDHLCSCAFL